MTKEACSTPGKELRAVEAVMAERFAGYKARTGIAGNGIAPEDVELRGMACKGLGNASELSGTVAQAGSDREHWTMALIHLARVSCESRSEEDR